MTKPLPFTAILVAALVLTAGCAPQAPQLSSSTTGTSPAPAAASTEPTASSTTSSPVEILLSGTGIGEFGFGDAEAEAEAGLGEVLGQPDDEFTGVLCELDSGSPWSRTLTYGALSVVFAAESKSKTAARTMISWSFRVEGPVEAPLAVQDDLPFEASFEELVTAFPGGTIEDTGLGDGSEIFTAPNGIRLIGSGSPELAQSGELLFCE